MGGVGLDTNGNGGVYNIYGGDQQMPTVPGNLSSKEVNAALMDMVNIVVRSQQTGGVGKNDGTGGTREVEIDGWDPEAVEADLAKLVAYLLLTSDEEQAKIAQERLKAQLDKMDSEQQKVLNKIVESIEETKRQIEAQKKSGILGWIMAALSVIAAAVTIAVTLGAATPLAVAGCVLACTSAALSLTTQALSASGVMEKHCESRAEEMMKDDPTLTKSEAMKKAQKEWNLGFTIASAVLAVASLGVGIASMTSLAKVGLETAKKTVEALSKPMAQLALKISSLLIQGSQMGLSITQTVNSFNLAELAKNAAETEAEIAELQAFLDLIKQACEEEEETLQNLLAQIADVFKFLEECVGEEAAAAEDIIANIEAAM